MKLKDWRAERTSKGICLDCPSSVKPGCRRCFECLEKRAKWNRENRNQENHYNYQKKRIEEFVVNGLCRHCGDNKMQNHTYCETCHLKNVSLGLTSRTEERSTNKLWKNLKEIYKSQDGVCPYTGRKIHLGQEAELDHKMPVCRGGKGEKENLQWVHRKVNRAKGDMSEEEFLDLVREVYAWRFTE
jgi:hypothetical protein